jgi:hypothetical protein
MLCLAALCMVRSFIQLCYWACRLLFCSTEDGQASMVRQLSPDVHIVASRRSVLALQRFTRRLVLLQAQAAADPELSQNVSVFPSLAAALGG